MEGKAFDTSSIVWARRMPDPRDTWKRLGVMFWDGSAADFAITGKGEPGALASSYEDLPGERRAR